MSTSGSSVCEDGLVDDKFLLYTTVPCSLRLNVHVGLSIFWVILYILLSLEVVVSRLLGCFSKYHTAKKITGNVLARDAAYGPLLVGSLIMFLIVVSDPQASVQDPVGAGIWVAAFISLPGIVALPAVVAVFNTQPLLSAIGVHSNTFKHADFDTRVFRILKYVQYAVCSSFFVVALVTLVILPNALISFHNRQMSINACFIAFGIAFGVSVTSVTATSEAIIKVVDARIQFEKELPAHGHSHSLSVARTRLRSISIAAPLVGLSFCCTYVLIGTNVIPLDWIVAHVIFGFLPASASITHRLQMKDSIIEAKFCCRESQPASPHHSSKDRDVSDHGGDKVSPSEKARASSDFTSETGAPSEMLSKLDLDSFKTPAHALLTLQEESK